jgi:hypothetical protein
MAKLQRARDGAGRSYPQESFGSSIRHRFLAGGNGLFSEIQSVINAATDANSVVWVIPGNYDSFTIGGTAVPSNLRILGDGSGPVNISTANGPIQIALFLTAQANAPS